MLRFLIIVVKLPARAMKSISFMIFYHIAKMDMSVGGARSAMISAQDASRSAKLLDLEILFFLDSRCFECGGLIGS